MRKIHGHLALEHHPKALKVLLVALAVLCIMALHLLISSSTGHTTAMATKMIGTAEAAEVNRRWVF